MFTLKSLDSRTRTPKLLQAKDMLFRDILVQIKLIVLC